MNFNLVFALSTCAIVAARIHYPREQGATKVAANSFSLPGDDPNPVARAVAIQEKRESFLYGPSDTVGGGPFYPAGSLGNETAMNDIASLQVDIIVNAENINIDMLKATSPESMSQYDNLAAVADYVKLYDHEWENSNPLGVASGLLTNFTDDLLFSMSRLSINPFSVRRFNSEQGDVPLSLAPEISTELCGMTVEELAATGLLFVVDYSSQASLSRTNWSAAACKAYFYIHPRSGDFLPLAIVTNTGANLTYTPLDTPDDWLLAKLMFNVNDIWFAEWYHLAGTHYVVEIVAEAAIRSLSDNHPVLALVKRLAFQAYSIRPAAFEDLLKPGKIIDSLFAFSGAAAINYTSELYISGLAGAFQANYFERNLAKRGMIHSTSGPQLKHFPFFEDGAKILSQIRKFIASFVDSYYHSVSDLEKDYELQAWVEEAWPAQIIDFPTAPITEKQTLIDILTHLAYLVSVLHPTLNTNSLIQTSAVLPFQPWALYQPIPTRKGVSNVTAFLPPLESALGQIAAGSAFSRQQFIGTNRTLTHMFDDDELLAKMNIETRQAATRFKDAMNTISKQISGRHFDQNGLSQGMPFLWKTLDPNVAPFSLAI